MAGIRPSMAGRIGGWMASRFGIEHILYFPAAAIAVGFVMTLFIIETAPARPRPETGDLAASLSTSVSD